MTVIDRIKEWLDQDKSVRMVADDIQITSELILLIRMMFADGELKFEEMEAFKKICNRGFGIPAEDVMGVIAYLRDIGYETSVRDAATMFEELDIERRRALLVHMYSVAKADNELDDREIEMIRKTASLLHLGPEDILKAGQNQPLS